MGKIGNKARVLIPSLRLSCVCLVCQNSVTRSAPINSDSQGRCGTRFLTTYDRRFVIKTVSSEDVAEMHNILKKYHQVLRVSSMAGQQRASSGSSWEAGSQ